MATLEDDQAELEDYPLWNWQPVKIAKDAPCCIRQNLHN